MSKKSFTAADLLSSYIATYTSRELNNTNTLENFIRY